MTKNKSRLLKPNPNMVDTKEVENFILMLGEIREDGTIGAEKKELINKMAAWINMRKIDARQSIQRAVGLDEIIEENGILYCIDFDTRDKLFIGPLFEQRR